MRQLHSTKSSKMEKAYKTCKIQNTQNRNIDRPNTTRSESVPRYKTRNVFSTRTGPGVKDGPSDPD